MTILATNAIDQYQTELHAIIRSQRAAYEKDGFPDAAVRIDRLERATALIVKNRDLLVDTISADFGHRSREDTLAELFATVSALRMAAENVQTWMQPEQRAPITPDAEARVEYTPLGVVGIIGPWNYPLTLIFGPLSGILAAGNRAVVKPSEFTPQFSGLLARLIGEAFSPDEISVVLGGAEEGAIFSAAPFDHLIFTGSTSVAKHVMRAASDNLTPVTLELGGKSPVIVTEQFDLAEAAARIMTVKTRNAGQICLAPDHVFVPAGSARAFADACVAATRAMFPEGIGSAHYTSIIADRHYQRLVSLIEDARAKGAEVVDVLAPEEGGNDRRLAPRLLLNATDEMKVMQEEVFGPLLPVVEYDDLDAVLAKVRSGPRPLAVYYFGKDDENARKMLDGTASGGVTINDVMAHVFCEDLPFGGIGASGMGSYHGLTGFRTFSHARAIYRQSPGREASALFRPPFGPAFEQFIAQALV
ncbi:coniferyl aldehyde dehydrogenase [Sphingomonas sp. dw_22]|uniref:coniferyl aldehyde dehydrogenase n=1 Tax=Sphingomonas sp. dw_22 TaxID=2721175 RepID=UPI001BD4A951|nr:coniferyl aldehyde dehydrogenase [Sphingomonas sp. dw_22]